MGDILFDLFDLFALNGKCTAFWRFVNLDVLHEAMIAGYTYAHHPPSKQSNQTVNKDMQGVMYGLSGHVFRGLCDATFWPGIEQPTGSVREKCEE